jgi:hypothetical protein
MIRKGCRSVIVCKPTSPTAMPLLAHELMYQTCHCCEVLGDDQEGLQVSDLMYLVSHGLFMGYDSCRIDPSLLRIRAQHQCAALDLKSACIPHEYSFVTEVPIGTASIS